LFKYVVPLLGCPKTKTGGFSFIFLIFLEYLKYSYKWNGVLNTIIPVKNKVLGKKPIDILNRTLNSSIIQL
jgi:hypothetical protein